MNENIQTAMTIMQFILTFGNLCIMMYALKTFLNKPHDTLEERVAVLEAKQDEVERRLHQGNKRFDEQDDTNEVILNSVLALIEFEIQYCLTEGKPISPDLDKAKNSLHKFLSRR